MSAITITSFYARIFFYNKRTLKKAVNKFKFIDFCTNQNFLGKLLIYEFIPV